MTKTKAQTICLNNNIDFEAKHMKAIQEIDDFINTHPNYHTIASCGIPDREGYIYDKTNDEWSLSMDFNHKRKTLIVNKNSITITSLLQK